MAVSLVSLAAATVVSLRQPALKQFEQRKPLEWLLNPLEENNTLSPSPVSTRPGNGGGGAETVSSVFFLRDQKLE